MEARYGEAHNMCPRLARKAFLRRRTRCRKAAKEEVAFNDMYTSESAGVASPDKTKCDATKKVLGCNTSSFGCYKQCVGYFFLNPPIPASSPHYCLNQDHISQEMQTMVDNVDRSRLIQRRHLRSSAPWRPINR